MAVSEAMQRYHDEQATKAMLEVIANQRRYQREKWGNENDDAHHLQDWPALLAVRVGRVADAAFEARWDDYREQLIKTAAIAVAALEAIERSKS